MERAPERALDLFASAPSREFVGALTGRECGGETTGAPSWYQAGDHSLPHTDWVGQRTVAFVWHLSKAWRPEWGGALYWAQHDHAVATYPASFNTLVLFSVTPRSAHFVTTVSPRHEGKRLTFNGWWQSAWTPRAADVDDLLGDRLATAERRALLTHAQLQAVTDLVDDPWQNFAGDRRDERARCRSARWPSCSRTARESRASCTSAIILPAAAGGAHASAQRAASVAGPRPVPARSKLRVSLVGARTSAQRREYRRSPGAEPRAHPSRVNRGRPCSRERRREFGPG